MTYATKKPSTNGQLCLTTQHHAMLRESCISDEVIKHFGLRTIDKNTINQFLEDSRFKSSGLLFPYHYLPIEYFSIRPDKPLSKKRKYERPRDISSQPYFTQPIRSIIESKQRLIILEGEKKALCGFCNFPNLGAWIGISGCFNWTEKDSHCTQLIDEFNKLNLENRNVVLVADSDYWSNSNVKIAFDRLADVLAQRYADVSLLVVPCFAHDKTGFDDFVYRHGYLAGLELFEHLQDISRPKQFNACNLIDYAKTYVPPEMLIEGILPAASSLVLGGAKKSGKTHNALDLALSLITGQPYLGEFKVNKRVNVYYLALESNKKQHICQPTLAIAQTKMNLNAPQDYQIIVSDTEIDANSPNDIRNLVNECLKHNCKVLIIDPMYSALEHSEMSDVSNRGTMLKRFASAFNDVGISVVFCHHYHKGKTQSVDDLLDMLSGAGFGEVARSWILIDKRHFDEKTLTFLLAINFGGQGTAYNKLVTLNTTPDRYHVTLQDYNPNEEKQKVSTEDRILDLLRLSENKKGLRNSEIADELGLNPSTVSRVLKKGLQHCVRKKEIDNETRWFAIMPRVTKACQSKGEK